MKQGTQERISKQKVPFGRMAVAAVALGGLTGTGIVLAAGTAGAATKVAVSTTKSSKFGTILVSGKTVYTLMPSKTACTANCLKIWPALTLPKGVTKATAGTGVTASKLGTVKMSNGAVQVTYAGKPLYKFSGDTGAGQVNGNVTDEWGKWSAVVTVKPAKSSSSSSSGSGGSTAGTGGASF